MNDTGKELLVTYFDMYGNWDEFKAYAEAQGYSLDEIGL